MARHDDPVERLRRFYKAVDVAPAEDGFAVRLDGRTPRSPRARPLRLPNEALAALVAEEWAAQAGYIMPPSMPATRLAWTAIDRAAEAREGLAGEVARYAGSDLVCYLAEGPDELVRRQAAHWGPLVRWADEALGLALVQTRGILHQAQPQESLDRCKALAAALDDFGLTGLAFGAGLFGSAVLAFALQRGEVDGERAFALSRLDEAFQEERWGIDAEAAERTAALRKDALALQRWFEALR